MSTFCPSLTRVTEMYSRPVALFAQSSGNVFMSPSYIILFTSKEGWKGPNARARALMATCRISDVLSPDRNGRSTGVGVGVGVTQQTINIGVYKGEGLWQPNRYIPNGSLRQVAMAAKAPALAPHIMVLLGTGAYSRKQEATPTWYRPRNPHPAKDRDIAPPDEGLGGGG
jgi:hypothetical protein